MLEPNVEPVALATASKSESGWCTREKKLLDEVEIVRGQRGAKRTEP